jgi:gluconolactonase
MRWLRVLVCGVSFCSVGCAKDHDVNLLRLHDSGADRALDASIIEGARAAMHEYPALDFSAIGQPTLVSGQYYFSEGPVWDPKADVLYFSDMNATQDGSIGGAIYKLTLPDTIEVVLQPARNSDGLALDQHGDLLAAGFASRSIWRLKDGAPDTISPCAAPDMSTCFNDTPINTPDDVVVRSDGVLYFSDPTFGNGAQGFPMLTLPLAGAQGVYRVTTDGAVSLEDSTTDGPNGLNFSPDEKQLYVSYTATSTVARFDVAEDGALSNKTSFVSNATIADSMCVDAGGNVYVGTATGLAVYDSTGMLLGTIMAGGDVTNCAFGGSDQKTLFITSRSLQSLVMPVANDSYLYQIDDMPVPGIPGRT